MLLRQPNLIPRAIFFQSKENISKEPFLKHIVDKYRV